MSKKDLLERISRNPATPTPAPRRTETVTSTVVRRAAAPGTTPPAGTPAPGAPNSAETTTRVSAGVVRRRRSADEASEVPVTVRRRTAVDVRTTPVVEKSPEPTRGREHSEPPAPRVEAPVEPQVEAPVAQVEAPPPVEVAPVPEPVAAVEKAAPEAVVEKPVAEKPVEKPVERPAEKPAEKPARGGRAPTPMAADGRTMAADGRSMAADGRSMAADGRGRDAHPEARAAAAHAADKPEGRAPSAQPDKPRYAGLGKAVVMPPPGYDPTNPTAWRRQALRDQAPQGGGGQWNEPGGNAGPDDRRPPGPDRGDSRARKAMPRRRGAVPVGEGMRRKPRRKMLAGAKAATSTVAPKAQKRKVRIDNAVSVRQLSHEMGVKAPEVIKMLMEMGQMATITEMLDVDTATLVASEFGFQVENVGFQEEQILHSVPAEQEEEGLATRPAVVTIMGHVDHGKTTLLDAIRKAKVAEGEAGGITQHIGAYQVDWKGRTITFLDTPGHAAFTQMRARGASVTDIVVLVVASDDGVQAQTEEAISHARAAEVPIIVAVNKMDKPGASADPIKQRLSEHDLVPEDWGGDVQFVPVSALKKQGIDELLESINIQADVLELCANADRPAEGTVIEAKVERGKGPVATILVQRGTLRRGDNVVLGSTLGKVRAMTDFMGRTVKEAGPSTPVEVFGIEGLPEVGDSVSVVKSDKDARTLSEHRAEAKRLASSGPRRRTAEEMFAAAQERGGEKEILYVVLKTDVQGSLEALKGALQALSVEGTELRILHAGVGNITESDVSLVSANGGLLMGFNVKVDPNARKSAEAQGVKPELYDIIYELLERVEKAMSGMIEPELVEVRQGSAEVRALFNISKVGTIAGSFVIDGKVGRSHGVRVLRAGKKIHEGKISTLKRFKDDVREVAAGYECGIAIENYPDVQVGDVLEVFSMEEAGSAG